MILINFAHPLTAEHVAHIEALAGQNISQVIEINSQIDTQQPLVPQVQAMADAVSLTPHQWQSDAILINLPSLNYSTALMLAELHGRMGYFPPIVRLRPVKNSTPTRFEVAEVINLQNTREAARKRRIDFSGLGYKPRPSGRL